MARDTLTGSVPMDVSAVYKGKSSSKGKGEKGKSNGKGKAKDRRIPRRTLMQRCSVTSTTRKVNASETA